ncbi:MAG: glycosyltransferase, partial [Halobacteriota archaeon]
SGVIETELLEAGVNVPIHRLPDPIDFERIAGTVAADRGEIVWAAQGAETAEVDIVLLSLAELRDRAWRGVLLGPMGDPRSVREAVDDLGLSDRVTVLDRVHPRERIAIYRGARVFIQTTPVSPFPTELLIAMAAGCVGVVQYQEYSSAHELVERSRTGELISTPEELADAVESASHREPRDLDERYRSYDGGAIASQLVTAYRSALERGS